MADKNDYLKEKELERLKGKYAISGALITGIAGIVAALLAGIATVAAALIGQKANKDAPANPVNNIKTGVAIVYNMAFSNKTLNESLPPKDRSEAVPGERAQSTRPTVEVARPPIQNAAVAVASLSSDPKVLDSCTGLSPLSFEKIVVEGISNGYNLSFRIKNDSKLGVSLWAEGHGTLNDNGSNMFPDGLTSIAQQYHIFDNVQQPALQNQYEHGEVIQAGDSGSFFYRYQQGKELTPATSVTLIANLDMVFKDDANQFTYKRTSLSCQELPVMTAAKK